MDAFQRLGRELTIRAFGRLPIHAYFLYTWKRKIPETAQAKIEETRFRFPGMFLSTEKAITELPPVQCGEFFSALCNCASLLCIFLLQNPGEHQVDIYRHQLHMFLLSCCNNDVSDQFDMSEFIGFVSWMMASRPYIVNGQSRPELDASFMPLSDSNALGRALDYVEKIQLACTYIMVNSHQAQFRSHFNWTTFLQVSRGFVGPSTRRSGPHPSLTLRVRRMFGGATERRPQRPVYNLALVIDATPDVLDESYEPVGLRVESKEFCTPLLEAPEHAECLICQEPMKIWANAEKYWEIDETLIDFWMTCEGWQKLPVTTKCHHGYHQGCLDNWVNVSCAYARNKCPLCRTELCRARGRHPRTVESIVYPQILPEEIAQPAGDRELPENSYGDHDDGEDGLTISDDINQYINLGGDDGWVTDDELDDELLNHLVFD
ncbi:hypothetical protein IQ07DRAFT_683299 [Pyrenochaeta sp. DS3sAY3a]|nr:hypothetical protein IQ07DRAFT_683299 [Pyrenochaeta sp. DS3sAY3a]